MTRQEFKRLALTELDYGYVKLCSRHGDTLSLNWLCRCEVEGCFAVRVRRRGMWVTRRTTRKVILDI